MKKTLKSRLFAVLALLLAFSLVFSGCESDERSIDRDDDEREEDREEDQNRNDEDTGENVIPVYETQEVYLCVRASTEQWDGTGTVVTEYEYDEYGNMTQSKNANYGNHMEYAYDADGNQIRSQYFSADGTAGSVTDMTYDADGRLLSSISTDSSGELSSEYYYTYDEAGFVIEEIQKMHYSDTEYRYVITYNDDHTQGTIQSYKNDELSGYTEETYDTDGNLLKSRSYRADGSFSSGIDCAYDEQGRIAVEWKYSDSETQADYDVLYTYDENGLLIFKDVDYYYGSGTTYEYELFEIQVRVN